MILHELRVIAQSDPVDSPVNSYTWRTGDDLADLEHAIAKLQEYLAARHDSLRTALMSQPTIEINAS